MKKKWVDPDDAPPLTGKEIHRPSARWRIAGKAVSPDEGRAAFRAAFRGGKTRVNIHLDNDVIAHFKQAAGERGYQTLINAALRRAVDSKVSESEVRNDLSREMARQFEALTKTLAESIVGIEAARGLAIRQAKYPQLNVLQWTYDAAHESIRVDARPTQGNNDLLELTTWSEGSTQ
jgi:uncharacterized protein (DUF4415 family)